MQSDTVKNEAAKHRVRIDRHTWSFHIVVPLILGLIFGFSQSGSEPMQGVTGYLAYWLISTFLTWQLLALGSKLVALTFKPFGIPLIIVLLLGFAIGITFWTPISSIRDLLVGGFVAEGESLQGYSRYSDLSQTIGNWILGASLWISANYFYFYVLGAQRFGYQPESDRVKRFRDWLLSGGGEDYQITAPERLPSGRSATEQPRLLERLKAGQDAEILALVAEDHYTRVLMPDRNELIYLRFSDAIRDMDDYSGLQVHRSYWVSLSAAKSYAEKGHRAFLTLSNGETIPVSRSFRVAVRNALS